MKSLKRKEKKKKLKSVLTIQTNCYFSIKKILYKTTKFD